MPALRPRAARISGLLATSALLSTALITANPAAAVSGPEPAPGAHPYTVRLNIGDEATSRACTGTLVDRFWVLTAASCLATTQGSSVSAGTPALATTATLSDGTTVEVSEVAPRTDRDAALVRLATPVTGIAPAPLAGAAPAAGAELQALGFGRTKSEWVPDKLHTGAFTLDSAASTTLAITGKGAAAICKGDAGGPLLNASGQIVAVNSRSWQGGCLGIPATETRTGAISARTDDLAPWLQEVRFTTASLQNTLSNLCAFVGWRTPDNGAPAQQADCNPRYADQVWKLEPVQGGYQIRNHYNNRCLVVSWRTPEDGAPVTQYDCHPEFADQVWKLEAVTGGGYSIRNSLSNKCMYVSWRTPGVGAPVAQVDCAPQYIDQVWKI
ncbi:MULTISPECIES: trypsin-like serine protease [unclassified Streptomyces]|uniref:trypsin-like serine protease n=1 Tax=unclassified Streptomyces TaxID=2593676 RepID=UPI0033DD607D